MRQANVVATALTTTLAVFALSASACDLKAPDAAKAGPGCAKAWMDANLAMNDIMTVGTHNSYKQAISDPIMGLVRAAAPKQWQALDYHHPPLLDQLNDGARALELDLVYDPKGGRFAHPAGMKLTGQTVGDDYVAAMSKPGFKVMHIQDIDFRSSCLTFIECLTIIHTWSLAHPDHVPILITMNTNDAKTLTPGGVDELPFDEAAYDALDAEIAQVFARDELITPDLVQGTYPTLREAVLKHGWPSLGVARGKLMFALDEEAPHIAAYRGQRHSLEGRILFVNTDENSPASAYLTLNEKADAPRIAADVKAGFIVRTRADADTVEARSNDVSRRDAALASGAQYVSTDYRHPETRFSDYQVRLPGDAIALCNPQRAPERCAGLPIEP
ncbi:MAG: phosphatidylinositol-specific phospholipase C1-like protein [Caulobacterales bacterium]